MHSRDFLAFWQEAVHDVINAADLDRELAATEGTVRRAIERRCVVPDHTLTLGLRTYFYFNRSRIPEIRVALGLPEVTAESIKRLFFEFIEEMDMSASYKPVLLLSFLDAANRRGRARVSEIVTKFRAFYYDRARNGLASGRNSPCQNVAILGVDRSRSPGSDRVYAAPQVSAAPLPRLLARCRLD
jgi:hypothetical protein